METISPTVHAAQAAPTIAAVDNLESHLRLPPWNEPLPKLECLPTDLILDITDLLSHSDIFLLSQTSSRLRDILSRDWATFISRLSPDGRREFWIDTVVRFLPNHWLCQACGKLHALDVSDLPSQSNADARRLRILLRLEHGCQRENLGDKGLAWISSLKERHIQMALKLTRLVNSAILDVALAALPNWQYREKIMRPFRASLDTQFGATKNQARAEPRIVAGRFLLMIEWDFDRKIPRRLIGAPDSQRARSWDFYSLHGRQICPHCPILPNNLPRPGTAEQWHFGFDGGSQAIITRSKARHHPRSATQDYTRRKEGRILGFRRSCKHCPMDYAVKQDKSLIKIRAWYDFGVEKSPWDSEWRSHYLWDIPRNAPMRPEWRYLPTHVPAGAWPWVQVLERQVLEPQVPESHMPGSHVPGSVMDLFNGQKVETLQ